MDLNVTNAFTQQLEDEKVLGKNFDTSEIGFSILHTACLTGMADICKLILKNSVDINLVDDYGRTPLMLACGAGFFSIAELLISSGADPNICDLYGFNALLMAIISGEIKLVIYLMDICKINSDSDISPLSLASSLGTTALVEIILKKTSTIDIQINNSGLTPLMLAVCGGHASTVELLLKTKPNLELKSHQFFTAFDYANFFKELNINLLFNKTVAKWLAEPSFQDSPRSGTLKPPLTPNLCLSPAKTNSPRKCITWIKKSLKPRSRSLDSRKKKKKLIADKYDNIMEYILKTANLPEYWSIFKEHEIDFKTFLTMNEDDLKSIGIRKESIRRKMTNLIQHYNKIFVL